jgi:hypothetical protein
MEIMMRIVLMKMRMREEKPMKTLLMGIKMLNN